MEGNIEGKSWLTHKCCTLVKAQNILTNNPFVLATEQG